MTVEEYFGYSREQIQSAIDFALEKGWNPPRMYRTLTIPVHQIVVGDEIEPGGGRWPVTVAEILESPPVMVQLRTNEGGVLAFGKAEFVTLRLPR